MILNCGYTPAKGYPEAWEMPYAHWCQKGSTSFIGFTLQEGEEKAYRMLGPQTYGVKGYDAHVAIQEEMQYAFNSYLLERNYHFGALMYIEYILRGNLFNIDYEVRDHLSQNITDILSWVLRLNAPILHIPFISFLNSLLPSCAFSKPRLQWIKQVIDFWNTTALPVLEELFLWSVCNRYKDNPMAVFAAIEDAFFTDTKGCFARKSDKNRCNRLTTMRIVERPQKARGPSTDIHSIDDGINAEKRTKDQKADEFYDLNDYLVRTALILQKN